MNIPPEQCKTLDEVRAGMNALDQDIIALFSKRVAFVQAAAKFKSSADAVADPDRMNAVFATRRAWAEQAGLDGAVIESLYRDLVAYCVSEEKKHWQRISDVS